MEGTLVLFVTVLYDSAIDSGGIDCFRSMHGPGICCHWWNYFSTSSLVGLGSIFDDFGQLKLNRK